MAEKKAKILSFERNAEYYYRRFEQYADQDQLFDALVSIRSAMKKDPENQEYQLCMSELLTEMGIYEESLSLLYLQLHNGCAFPADILFNLGCNYYGLRDYEKAQHCLTHYLTEYPDGDFAEEAFNMLDIIDEEQEMQEDPIELSPEDSALADHGKYLTGICDFEGAIKVFRQLLEKNPDLLFIENNLALAYFCCDDIDNAILTAGNVLKKDSQNLHAICNLAMFYYEKGVSNSENLYLSRMNLLSPTDIDDITKLLLTYCELAIHEKVYSLANTILRQDNKYDPHIIFLTAIASVNIGKYAEALAHFENLLKLNPLDSIAAYYKSILTDAIKKNSEIPPLTYDLQVPPEEMRRRLEYLSGCVQNDAEKLQEIWQKDDFKLKHVLSWGMYYSDPTIKRICLELLNIIGDADALQMLQYYLLKATEPNELKQEVFHMLNSHHVPLPYLAYMNGNIAEVNIQPLQESGFQACHIQILECIASFEEVRQTPALLKQCTDLFQHYLQQFEKAPTMRNPENWAAAILYAVYMCNPQYSGQNLQELCNRLHVPFSSVQRCVRKLSDVFEEVR